MKLAQKPLAVCMATLFSATSFSVCGAPPSPQNQNPTARQPDAVPPPAAQPVPETRPITSLFPAQPKEFPGIAWGSFLAYPELSLAATYDDNIYAERRGPVDDVGYTLSPALTVKSNWKKHALNLDAGGDFDRYRKHDAEDVNDYWLGFDGHYDLGARSNIFGGARHSRDHEDRSTAGALDPTVQVEPTRYDHEEAHLGLAHAAGAFRLRAGGTWDRYDFKNGERLDDTVIDSDFRDHDLGSLGVRLGYVLSPKYEIFTQYATDRREYDNPIPTQSFSRDSNGYTASLGMKFTPIPQRLAGEAYAGVMRQDYDFSGFSDLSKPYYGAVVVWKPVSPVTATGFIDRTLEETTVFDGTDYASGAVDTTVGFEVERRLSSKLSVSGSAAYTRSDFQSFERLDKIIDAGAGLRYYVMPTVFIGADLRVIDRDSDNLFAQYTRNQALLSVGYTPARNRDYALIPEREAGAPAAPRAQGLFSGFYLGAQIGYGALTADTSGLRGETAGDESEGSDDANMGDFGASYGLFGGWGTEINSWYVGAELDAGDSRADWFHKKDKPQAPTEFVEKDSGYGLSLRAGYVLDGALLYGRLGVVETDFHSFFAVNQYAAGAFDQKDSETGVRLGLGLEIPASSELFVRTDYSVTDYDDYQGPHQASIDGDIASETFDNRDNVFSLGIGWRFGGGRPAVAPRPATELDGLYAGASLGHATLGTHLTRTHEDGGAARLLPPFGFTGDFADSGFSGGFFAGYGHTFSQVYLGLELDAEAANFGWEHVRTSGGGGRDFAAEKRGGYSGSLRLGHVLGNGSLLYGRLGAVRTRFNTIYSKGAIDRSDRLDGTRFGLGAEIPAAENTFVRMDYSYTRYEDTVDFATPTDRVDDMRFDNRESLARLDLGFRF